MAHFIGYMKGSRGDVSRLGTPQSGIQTQIQGWSFGMKAGIFRDERDKKDKVHIYLTGGSNAAHADKFLGTFSIDDLLKEGS